MRLCNAPSLALLQLIGAAFLLAGCSGRGATPLLPSSDPVRPAAELPLEVAPRDGNLVLGQVSVSVDGNTGNVTADPVRLNQAIGDAWLVGLNQLDALCQCFKVTGVTRTPVPGGAEVTLQVAFDHPFKLATRPDLFGWDLKAILATDRNAMTFISPGVTVPTGVLLNATGYTEEWTDQIRTALPQSISGAYPYVILGEDRRIPVPFDFQQPHGWNVFPSGGTNTGELVLFVPTNDTLNFDLFFTVGYQVSATRTTRQNPNYQPPRGNTRAPFRVDAEVTLNGLTAATGTFATMDLEIFDWQHLSQLGSDVTAINVYAPTLTANPINPPLGTGTGRDTDPITASFSISNTLGTYAGGTTYALVEVRDELHQQNPGGLVGQPGVGVVGDNFQPAGSLNNVRTFQVIPLEVDSNLPGDNPTAIVTSTPPHTAGVLNISINTTVQWDASSSTDPDPPLTPEGTIVAWEWDFEWDGNPANFVDDTAGSGTVNEPHQYTTVGTTTLGCRVTDGVGRKSAIAAITVNISNQTLQLVLESIVDVDRAGWLATNEREFGPALVERSTGDMAVNFHAERDQGGGGYYSVGIMSTRNSGTGMWDLADGSLGSSGGLQYGWVTKTCPAWALGHTINTHTFTWRPDHPTLANEPAHEIVFGYTCPNPPNVYAVNARHSYGTDVACSRVDNSIYFFEDRFSTLRCSKGGPNYPDQPLFWWWDDPSIVYTAVDARPSVVSRSRSTFTGADGSLHLAYRSQTGHQLRYAKNANGNNITWTLTDLATDVDQTFGDPSFDLDEAGGATIAVTRQAGANYEIVVFNSSDNGATWSGPIVAGPSFTTRPAEIAVSVRWILGMRIIVVGYATQATPSFSEARVRWSADTATWTDQLMSAGADAMQPDVLLKRTGNEFYGTWVTPGTAPRQDVVVRRGTFQYL
ncbi:MAG: hypothetical protein GEEBNDBF_01410 [bacterium]|nr:hypothetical protein [bacterium]MCG3152122.1 hypothetical protein [bacterium]